MAFPANSWQIKQEIGGWPDETSVQSLMWRDWEFCLTICKLTGKWKVWTALKQILTAYRNKDYSDWDVQLPNVALFACRNSVHLSSGVSPFRAVYSCKANTPLMLMIFLVEAREQLVYFKLLWWVGKDVERCPTHRKKEHSWGTNNTEESIWLSQ